jgi:hypothetical protein
MMTAKAGTVVYLYQFLGEIPEFLTTMTAKEN